MSANNHWHLGSTVRTKFKKGLPVKSDPEYELDWLLVVDLLADLSPLSSSILEINFELKF